MKLTEELLKEMEKKKELYGDGIIMPDGDYRLIQDGHLKTLMALLPYTENEIWKMIPEDDSALFWLVEKTGCVLTDVNSAIGMKMTLAQQKTYEALSSRGIISDEYYDLTRQREKVKLPGRMPEQLLFLYISRHTLPGRNVSRHLSYRQ